MYEGFIFFESFHDPFSPLIEVKFRIPEIAPVKITLYDTAGKLECVMMDKSLRAGVYIVKWSSRVLIPGSYYIRIESGEYSSQRKIDVF